MKYTGTVIFEIPDSDMEDSRERSPPAETSGKSSVILCDNTSSIEQGSRNTRSPSRMTDLEPVTSLSQVHSPQKQKNPGIKRSRSPSPLSTAPDTPSYKRQMISTPTKPGIKTHDYYEKVQKRLSPYGLGPYDGPVASDKWLPFSIQSKILTRAQVMLEEALFEFLKTNHEHVCEENGWEEMGEAELIELAVAIMIQFDWPGNDHFIGLLDETVLQQSSETFPELLLKIGQIRHCAVHRTKKIPVITLELMIRDAVFVAACIQDKERTGLLDNLCRPLEPLSFNLQARFGAKLIKKAERNVEKVNKKIKELQELLRDEEIRLDVAKKSVEHIEAQDERVYEGELEALKKAI